MRIYKVNLKLQKSSAKKTLTVIIWMACSRCQFYVKQNRNLLTLIMVHNFLWVKDVNGSTWRYSNGIFKHKNVLNENVQIWWIYSLASLCSQSNLAYHLCNACIVYARLNTVSDVRINWWQCLVKWVISSNFGEHSISLLHESR